MQKVRPVRFSFFIACFAFLIALIASTLCRVVAGISLGLFFGAVAFATLLVPPLAAGESSGPRRLLVPLCATVGTAVVWLTAVGDLVTVLQWLACCVALLAYAFALCCLCSLLLSIRFHPAIAAAAATVLGMLWLTWPVWLSAALRGPSGDTMVAWLVPAHPLAAINAVLVHFGTWDRYPLAYRRLTVLNQDVFYALPLGIAWTVIVHGLLGAAALSVERWVHPRRPAPMIASETPPAAT